MNVPFCSWLWIAMLGLAFAANGEARELAVGDTVPAFSARDQFGTNYTFAPGPKFLLLGFDMGASKAANAKFTALGDGGLEKLKAVYVMDIHTMPAIGRFFALPKMRKFHFHVVLADSADLLKPFPHQDKKLTLLVLAADGTIHAIRYWNPETEEFKMLIE